MKYIDLHCDALTTEGVFVVTKENLRRGGCLLQCFAAFLREREDRFARALAMCDKFDKLCETEGYVPVRRASDICPDKLNAMLTVEEGGAVEGSLEKLRALFDRGVRMMTLTWNYPNELGFPAIPDYAALTAGRCSLRVRERERGLTPLGREIVCEMARLGMIADVSHGSDKLVSDVAETLRAPFAASHSGADAVFPCARNLTDGGIRLIAKCGGVIGLDFCAGFLSSDRSEEGQRAAILAHAEHIIKIGGEDVLALGSDFDGTPPNPYIKTPARMAELAEELQKKFGSRAAEKIVCKNALRLFGVLK